MGLHERAMAVLEELLLPQVKQVDGDVVPITGFRDRLLVEQVLAQVGDFLFGAKVPTRLSHDEFLRCSLLLTAHGEKSRFN